jgi:LPPG:FO 2-phospho-L-lactate transferase
MRALLGSARAPVLAVSPFVAGEVIKGPTDRFMRAVGSEPSAAGVARAYEGLIDAIVVDAADPGPAPAGVESHRLDTLMSGSERRRQVAAAVLELCSDLARR